MQVVEIQNPILFHFDLSNTNYDFTNVRNRHIIIVVSRKAQTVARAANVPTAPPFNCFTAMASRVYIIVYGLCSCGHGGESHY